MVAVIDNFLVTAGPAVTQAIDVIVQFIQLGLLLALIGYGYILWKFDTRVNVREYSKGGRIITFTTRAVRIKDKNTGSPKLRFFGMMGFKGEIINEPPAECLVAHKSRITTKMYDFVRKDGIYFPIQNFVLGIKREVKNEDTGNIEEIYTIKGSGLEVSRDYDAEQAIQNTLIEKATVYRNRKPTEIIASYALMIITIIVSGVVMWFAWKQFGNMAGAIASLNEPLRQGIVGAAQNILGPG
jgi:DNA-binding protein|tara:strand:+ start:3999 stop:4721 length:723 start_codon:yes stop_codon:yes gene_type:complete